MAEENLEETQENPEEVETSEEKTTEGEAQVSPEKKPEEAFSEREQALYARMKKAEAEAKELKELKEKLEKSKTSKKEETSPDILNLARTVSALKDFSAEELEDIALISKAKEISLEEAAKTEEAKILIAAKREKVAKEKEQLEPSTRVSPSKTPIEKIPTEEIRKLTPKEREQWYIAHGIEKRKKKKS